MIPPPSHFQKIYPNNSLPILKMGKLPRDPEMKAKVKDWLPTYFYICSKSSILHYQCTIVNPYTLDFMLSSKRIQSFREMGMLYSLPKLAPPPLATTIGKMPQLLYSSMVIKRYIRHSLTSLNNSLLNTLCSQPWLFISPNKCIYNSLYLIQVFLWDIAKTREST